MNMAEISQRSEISLDTGL